MRQIYRLALACGAGLLVGNAAIGAPACSLHAPEQCRDTNRLAWSPGFGEAVRHFIGKDAALPKGLDDMVLEALRGPPQAPISMLGGKDGGWLFSACAAHDCPTKVALLLGSDNSMRAIAVFDLESGHAPNPRLDLVLKSGKDDNAQALLTAWSTWVIAQDNFAFSSAPWLATHISSVKVFRAAP